MKIPKTKQRYIVIIYCCSEREAFKVLCHSSRSAWNGIWKLKPVELTAKCGAIPLLIVHIRAKYYTNIYSHSSDVLEAFLEVDLSYNRIIVQSAKGLEEVVCSANRSDYYVFCCAKGFRCFYMYNLYN